MKYGAASAAHPTIAQAVGQSVAVWVDEITVPPPDLPLCSWLFETSLGWRNGDGAAGSSPPLLTEADLEMDGGGGCYGHI